MKKILKLLSVFLLILLFTSCTETFNNKEYEYLTNSDNYETYSVKLDYHNVKSNDYYNDSHVLINVTFFNVDDYNYFSSFPLEKDSNLDSYSVTFTIHSDNKKILFDNNFFTDIKNKDTFTIKACKYADNNDKFLFIAGIEYNGKIYLSIEDGIKGVSNFLDEHKSPFFN